MSQFYGHLHYEYDESIVVKCLLDELAQERDNLTPWKLQKCLEKAMFDDLETLSDQKFSLWVSIFANRCAQYPETFQMYQIEKEIREALFTKRGLLIQRINSKMLYEYLYNNMASYIDGPQTCYSVLYFVFNSVLKMKEKLELLNKIEQYVPQYGFEEIYERTFCSAIDSAQSEKKFKKNLKVVAEGQVAAVNYINGKNAAVKYLSMPSVCEKEIETIIWDLIDYIKVHKLISQIDVNIGNNESFLDFFVRRCFEKYLYSNVNAIRTIYQHFEKFFEFEKPFGHFIKRNLTCAAGNIFSNMHNQNYNELYISLTKEMAGSEIRMNRLTAFFLIENSIDEESTELAPELKEILLELSMDKDLFAHYSERIQKLIS